jgi:hypothetical protein
MYFFGSYNFLYVLKYLNLVVYVSRESNWCIVLCNFIVNWQKSSAYKLTTHITKTLKDTVHLPNAFNVHNSVGLIHNLKEIHMNNNTRICSFVIRKIYTNISIRELTDTIRNILDKNNTSEKQKQAPMTLINTVVSHNYLQFNNEYYKQDN